MVDQPLVLPDVFEPDYAEQLMAHARGYPAFALSSDGGAPTGRVVACNVRAMPAPRRTQRDSISAAFAPGTGARQDAAANFVRTGGRLGHRHEAPALRAARTNYLRATYVAGRSVFALELLGLLHHRGLAGAASALYGADVVLPTQVYANVMLPGQELGVHTDVPEFRGAHRGNFPFWLLVAMHHSGLFDRWRVQLATAVVHFGHTTGGQFAFYPTDVDAPPTALSPRHNQALVLDTDTVFHGVDRVDGDDAPLARLRSGQRLRFDRAAESWLLSDGDEVVAAFAADAPRYSISWKAQCFADEGQVAVSRTHTDDLTFAQVITALSDQLQRRGRLTGRSDVDDDTLARLIIDEFIRFPAAREPAGGAQ